VRGRRESYPHVVHLPQLMDAVVHRLQQNRTKSDPSRRRCVRIKEWTRGGKSGSERRGSGMVDAWVGERVPSRPQRRRRQRTSHRPRCGASPPGRERRRCPWLRRRRKRRRAAREGVSEEDAAEMDWSRGTGE
jgi:hypothetical protein